jgi:glycosyltransferase involved in cell wall biosynthesis
MSATISVVIPAFNLVGVIGTTLRTVLAQTVLPDEVIVVDDGSSDGTVEEIEAAAEQFPAGVMRIVHGSHCGPGAARNQGMAAANGDWIAFLDGDDLWDPTKIEKLRDFIAVHPGVTVIAHDEYERAVSGETIYKPLHQRFDSSRPLLRQLYRANFLSTSCVAVRRDLAFSVGWMDETLPAAQDYDFWLKVARRGSLGFIPEPLETYVLRPGNITSNVLVRYDCMVRIAFRHAPWVAAETGAVRAWLLRIRYLVAMQKGLLKQTLRAGKSADSLRVVIRAPRHLLRAVLSPLGKL